MKFASFYENYCIYLKETNQFRKLPLCTSSPIIDFSSNDFLKLSIHPKVLKAAHQYSKKYGAGATGSRLLSGNKECFQKFEERIAQDKNSENALIFSSGYQANSTILASLLDAKILKSQVLVFFDKLNHSSLYHGVLLSEAHLIRYRHLDLVDLKKRLQEYQNDPRPKFIVSETLFSMDGDIVDLASLISLAKEYQAFLYLDEAYATGVFGTNGYGFSTLHNFQDIEYLVMGTFSKALGCCGAYAASRKPLMEYLINRCTGFIYSTAPSPMIIGAAHKAWTLLPELEIERKALLQKASFLREELRTFGWEIGNTTTHIIPIFLGSEEKTLSIKDKLHQQGILVSAIRPPTVPVGTSRLRIALNLQHTKQDLEKLLQALRNL